MHDVNEDHIRQQAVDASLPQEMPMTAEERVSRESSSEGHQLLQVPALAKLKIGPYYDNSDSELSEGDDFDDPDDLEGEEKALISSYLHGPPALHIRR